MLKRLLVVSIVGAVAALVGAAPLAARDGRLTRGDAVGYLIRHEPFGDRPPGLWIDPFTDDLSYCAFDWHVIAVTVADSSYVVPDLGVSHDGYAEIAGTELEFVLDGTPIEVMPYRIKAFEPDEDYLEAVEWDVEEQRYPGYDAIIGTSWSRLWGTALSPNDLAIGWHTLGFALTSPQDGRWEQPAVTFQISGSACSGNEPNLSAEPTGLRQRE